MNYYEARQTQDKDGKPTGVWHFTCRNDDRIWPVGCTRDCNHATPEEACQHWVDTEIARGVRHGRWSWTTCDFRDTEHATTCSNPAQQVLTVGGPHGIGVALCDEHATDEIAVALFRSAHSGAIQIVSSL